MKQGDDDSVIYRTFSPPFREAIENFLPGGRPDLRYPCGEPLTVAGQYRTYTGFAIKPSHPGVKGPSSIYLIVDLLYAGFNS
jgi:hypothetical protein